MYMYMYMCEPKSPPIPVEKVLEEYDTIAPLGIWDRYIGNSESPSIAFNRNTKGGPKLSQQWAGFSAIGIGWAATASTGSVPSAPGL